MEPEILKRTATPPKKQSQITCASSINGSVFRFIYYSLTDHISSIPDFLKQRLIAVYYIVNHIIAADSLEMFSRAVNL